MSKLKIKRLKESWKVTHPNGFKLLIKDRNYTNKEASYKSAVEIAQKYEEIVQLLTLQERLITWVVK